MKGKELIKKLEEGLKYDDLMNEEITLADILDNLGEIGIPGASECYFYHLKEGCQNE